MDLTAVGNRRWLLLDKSALVRSPQLDDALGEPCLCAVTRLEMLHNARSATSYEDLGAELAAFHELRMDAETIETAQTAQRELAKQSQHRVPIPDLLIAACAQPHRAAVLHVDRHYERSLACSHSRPYARKPEIHATQVARS